MCASSTSLSGYIRAGLNCRRNQRTEAKAAARFPPLMPVASVCACLEAAAYVGRDKCIRHIEGLPFVPTQSLCSITLGKRSTPNHVTLSRIQVKIG